MQTAREQFNDWMEKRDVDVEQMADTLDVSESYIYYLKRGERTPRLKMAVRIERMMGIPASLWMSSQLDKPTEPRRKTSTQRRSGQRVAAKCDKLT